MSDNINQLLSKKQKILKLSNDAIKDIYTRQHLFKSLEKRAFKRFNQTITTKDKAFKQLDLTNTDHVIYKAFREHLDVTVYNKLNSKNVSLEVAYFDEVTNDKFTEKEKIEIARKKLIEITECCGTPHVQLVHDAVNSYAEIEDL